jgi:SPW repeat
MAMAKTLQATDLSWQDVGNLVLGAWLFISPWILGFSALSTPAINAWVFGAIVALLALAALYAYQKWEEWLSAAIGVWVFISPWVLGFSYDVNILWNSLIVGALLVILALWSANIEHGHGQITARS